MTNSLKGTRTTAFLKTKAMAISLAANIFASRNQHQKAWTWCTQQRSHSRTVTRSAQTEWKYAGGVEVIEQQTADSTLCFDGTERNRNVTVFMPPTVPQLGVRHTGITCEE